MGLFTKNDTSPYYLLPLSQLLTTSLPTTYYSSLTTYYFSPYYLLPLSLFFKS